MCVCVCVCVCVCACACMCVCVCVCVCMCVFDGGEACGSEVTSSLTNPPLTGAHTHIKSTRVGNKSWNVEMSSLGGGVGF